MISLLLTCFSFAAAADTQSIAANVTGTVELVDSRDPSVRKRDFSGVAIWLERLDGAPAPAAPRTVQMIQKSKRFTPHVVAIPVGSTVDFPNFDPIFHNAFSNFSGQPFDVGLYAPGSRQKIVFRREGIVRVFCNIHPTMSAVIVVTNSPYAAVSARNGAFSMESVPEGRYRLRVFHERATPEKLAAVERDVTIGPGPSEIPALRISESGYIQLLSHKNKHGKDYPRVIEDRAVYSPGRK